LAGRVEIIHEMIHRVLHEAPADSSTGVLDHLLRFPQNKVEDVPVDLLLDGVEVKVLFGAHCFVGVGVHDDREVLVDEAYREDLAVRLAGLVQECDSVLSKVNSAAPEETSVDDRWLTSASV